MRTVLSYCQPKKTECHCEQGVAIRSFLNYGLLRRFVPRNDILFLDGCCYAGHTYFICNSKCG